MLPQATGAKKTARGEALRIPAATVSIDTHRRRQLIFFLMGGFRFGMAENAGWRCFLGEYDIPVVPRSTLRDWAWKLHKELVRDPIDAAIAKLREPKIVTDMDGHVHTITPLLSVAADGWTGPTGQQFETMELSGGSVVTTSMGGNFVRVLQPTRPPLSLLRLFLFLSLLQARCYRQRLRRGEPARVLPPVA